MKVPSSSRTTIDTAPSVSKWGVGLAFTSLLPSIAFAASFSTNTVDWMQGPPDLNGTPAYNQVHYETRLATFDPQSTCAPTTVTEQTPWTSTAAMQPFKMQHNKALQQIYFRKDYFDDCTQTQAPGSPGNCNFAGEVWDYDASTIKVRAETFGPPFGTGPTGAIVDPDPNWSVRWDKFRLMDNSRQAGDHGPFGFGRIFAPVQVQPGWKSSEILNSFACLSWQAFLTGQCPEFQQGVVDTTYLDVINGFSTVFDGTVPGFPADPEYQNFDQVLRISQIMPCGSSSSMERFYFAAKTDPTTGAPLYYGIVRWDSSMLNAQGQFVTVARTTSLRRMTDHPVTFAGMQARGINDYYTKVGGLRILEQDSFAYQDANTTKSCPRSETSYGSFHVSANSSVVPSNLYDLDGFSTTSGGWSAICYDPTKAEAILTLPNGCPQANQRGSFFVQSAVVATGLYKLPPVQVNNGWVSLCAGNASDHSLYLSAATNGQSCAAGSTNSGSFVALDCYDANGVRCNGGQPGWVAVCSQ